MARDTDHGARGYDRSSARTSRNLLYLLGGLVALIAVVFAILHGFGMTLGQQI